MEIPVWLAACAGVAAAVMGCAAPTGVAPGELAGRARAQLAGEAEDSDAAVILNEAIERADRAEPEAARAILEAALVRAREAGEFRIKEESPLPEGWPRPSLPGLIRVKSYPPVRSAWVRSPEKRNRQFMVLFRHIQDRQIAMTAPVVMEYGREAAGDPGKMDSAEAMAFLYRRTSQGQAGADGLVAVENAGPLKVVSVGMKGAYWEGSFRRAAGELVRWLSEHPQWRAAGPPRVLAYNSPFTAFWVKYSEVQIPIEPATPATGPRP